MPRPGPRPYKCERRAWHSERHQPMRGSLIQEIFRVANEIHGSSTRRNKEWREKLPVVVLKVEEIIYSKANSEAEYVDLSTLLDRTYDAIDTIIRRDETTEIGEPLPPCIEAALTLGCTPRRASRGQCKDSPQSYLRQSTWELVESSPVSVGKLASGNDWGVVPDNTNSRKVRCFPLCLGNGPGSSPQEKLVIQRLPCPYGLDSAVWSYSGHPLYSGSCTQFVRDACGVEVVPSQYRMVGNAMGTRGSLTAKNINASEASNSKRTGGSPQCDLSLRLGPNPVTGSGAEDIHNDRSPGSTDDMPVWRSNKRSSVGELLNGDHEVRLRKKIVNGATYGYPNGDRCPQFGLPDDLCRNLRA